MTVTELYQQILDRFYQLPGVSELLKETIQATASEEPEHTLLPENDPPSTVAQPEYCVTAELKGTKGEAYTRNPENFKGTLKEALELPVSEQGINAVSISAINAVMNYLKLSSGTFPEDPAAHYAYADALCRFVTERYGKTRIVLVGYDGYIVKRFMDEGIDFWTLDKDPAHISQNRFHHVVVNGAVRNRESSFKWGNIFIVTGSTLCNGTIIPYLNSGKELLFYGITCAGAATLLNLPWFAPEFD